MRRVAAALDTGAASLYVYVSGREGLLQAMLDRVTATIELEAPDPSRWRAQLHSLLQRMHQALVAHPGIAAMTLADSPTTEAVLRLTENLLGILLAGGLDPQDAAWACDIFVSLVTAAAREDDVRRPRGRSDDDGRPRAGRRALQNLRRLTARPVPSSRRPRRADGRRRWRRAVSLRHRRCYRRRARQSSPTVNVLPPLHLRQPPGSAAYRHTHVGLAHREPRRRSHRTTVRSSAATQRAFAPAGPACSPTTSPTSRRRSPDLPPGAEHHADAFK